MLASMREGELPSQGSPCLPTVCTSCVTPTTPSLCAVVALAPNVGSALKRSWQGAGGTILGSALGIAVMAIMERIIGSSAFNQHPVASVRNALWYQREVKEEWTSRWVDLACVVRKTSSSC